MTAGRSVEVDTISDGWIGACRALLGLPTPATTHLLIRMSDPLPENTTIRQAADAFLEAVPGCQPINEVRNTIFPAELAEEFPDPERLASEYLSDYDFIRRLGSSTGTYFGRICAYPRADGSTGAQLADLARKLRAASVGRRQTSTYEVNIYSEWKDVLKPRGFPCMSHLAFHVDHDRLDCLATYRNHDLIKKGYGNYLGLAELQRYLAAATGFVPGELVVLAGHADFSLSAGLRLRLRDLIGVFS